MIDKNTADTKERLILAGIDEISSVGVDHFSTRNVAKRCNLSYNAPYKHFKNTQEFIFEIFGYIDTLFLERQEEVLKKHTSCSSREQLVEVSMEFICFLTDHPEFLKIILQGQSDCDQKYRCLRGELSETTLALVNKYCEEQKMPADVKYRKLFVVRSFIYGAAFFFHSGKMDYTEENLNMVKAQLDREFDLV